MRKDPSAGAADPGLLANRGCARDWSCWLDEDGASEVAGALAAGCADRVGDTERLEEGLVLSRAGLVDADDHGESGFVDNDADDEVVEEDDTAGSDFVRVDRAIAAMAVLTIAIVLRTGKLSYGTPVLGRTANRRPVFRSKMGFAGISGFSALAINTTPGLMNIIVPRADSNSDSGSSKPTAEAASRSTGSIR